MESLWVVCVKVGHVVSCLRERVEKDHFRVLQGAHRKGFVF